MIRTAECVSPMHPDKMCDRISDTLLDLHLEQDPNSRCAIETCGGMGEVYITGEVTSNAVVTRENIVKVVHDVTTDNTINVIINIKRTPFSGSFVVSKSRINDPIHKTGYS